MGCSGLPGVILITAATVLLLLVTVNTPLLKSLYFFRATFNDAELQGELKLGTLGYCLTQSGNQTCVGPQIGYSLDLNKMLNISTQLFSIPSAVSKWMTYTLVLHIVGLGFGAIGVLFGLLDIIPGFNMICFPTCMAGFCGTITLIALIFDLVMFYIFKASVNRVSGANGEIGAAVWMTLAAWLLACFAGCAYGMGRCCCDCGGGGSSRRDRRRDRERDRELENYRRDEELRLDAIRDEHRRKNDQERGLPAFPEAERMPLNDKHEDKYLYDDEADHIPRVGAGYGRRDPDPYGNNSNLYQHDYNYGVPNNGPQYGGGYEPSVATAGAAGVGAGGAGVAPSGNIYGGGGGGGGGGSGYDYDYGNANRDYNASYNDPYQQQPNSNDPYTQPYSNNYAGTAYPPQAAHPEHIRSAAVTPAPYIYRSNPNQSTNQHVQPNMNTTYTTASSESGYPTSPVTHAAQHQDDGYGAIGRAATTLSEPQYPATNSQTTTFMSAASSNSNYSTATTPLQPVPMHLRTQHSGLLSQPIDEHQSDAHTAGTRTSELSEAPPSYGQISPVAPTSGYQRPHEKGRPI